MLGLQLELRLLAHLADCKSMLEAFKVGGDFHSRTAMNMYSNVKDAVEKGEVLLEWEPKPGEDSPPCPLLKVISLYKIKISLLLKIFMCLYMETLFISPVCFQADSFSLILSLRMFMVQKEGRQRC